MIRILPSFNIVPRIGTETKVILIVGMSTWDGHRCTGSTPLFNVLLDDLDPVKWTSEFLPAAMDWAEEIKVRIGDEMERRYHASNTEVNARPADTSS